MLSRSFLIFSVFSSSVFASQTSVFSRWTVDSVKSEKALERYQLSILSGLSSSEGYFYLGTPKRTLEKRLISTGETVWAASLDGEVQSEWVEADGFIYGGDTKGNIYSVQKSDGAIKWKNSTKGVFFAKPLVGNSTLWVMNSLGALQAYDRESGQWKWQQTDPQPSGSGLWSPGGVVAFQNFIIGGFSSGVIQAFDPESGKLMWKESFASSSLEGFESFNDLKSVSSHSDYLIASSFSGDLKVWKTAGPAKKLLWQKRISLYSPVKITDDGMMYLSARDGSVQALELETGYVKWKYELPRGLAATPSVFADKIWVGTSAGEVFVFSLSGDLKARSHEYESPIWNPIIAVAENSGIFVTARGIIRSIRLL